MSNTYEDNIGKIRELLPGVQWAAEQGMNDCIGLNLMFRILEAYRTPEQQHLDWLKGRDENGNVIDPKQIVTYEDGYKNISFHEKRLAFDIDPINCTYDEIADVMSRYGITHPFPSYSGATFIDQPHFQLDQVAIRPLPQSTTPTPLHLSWEAEKERFWRGVDRLPAGLVKDRAIKRYEKIYGPRL